MIRKLMCAAVLLVCSAPAYAQDKTIMDLINEAKANNAALSLKVDATSAKVDALGAAFNVQAQQMAAMQAKLDKIHVAIVQNPQLLVPAPMSSVTVPLPPPVMVQPAFRMTMSTGACAGSCGSMATRGQERRADRQSRRMAGGCQ
jgi:hypothetical protein